MATTIQIPVPESFRAILGERAPGEERLARWSFEALVIEAYREGLITRGKIGELLDLTFQEREAWLKDRDVPVRTAPVFEPDPGIDLGESEAIALPKSLGVPALIDDRRGREYASGKGVVVIGTIGVLFTAAKLGLLDFNDALQRLQATNFHISREHVKSLTESLMDF